MAAFRHLGAPGSWVHFDGLGKWFRKLLIRVASGDDWSILGASSKKLVASSTW